jgi:hypothetical protein
MDYKLFRVNSSHNLGSFILNNLASPSGEERKASPSGEERQPLLMGQGGGGGNGDGNKKAESSV